MVLTTLRPDLTALHGSPLESLRHQALKRHLQAQREMNELQEFCWFLGFHSVTEENNLLLPEP